MKVKPAILRLAALTISALATSHVHSHTRWDPAGLTPPRTNADNIKSGPCGAARTNSPTVLESGSTINVQFESTIFHRGDFRIAFSEANDEGFDEHVLVDYIQDFADQRYRNHEVNLPDIECDQCTLQLIQVMRDRTPPTNYYSCADIKLVRSNVEDTTPPKSISNFVALPGDGQAMLSWTQPSDNDFAGVLLLEGSEPFNLPPTDGRMYTPEETIGTASVIYNGSGNSSTASGLTAGATAYFAAFAYDQSFNYSTAVETSVSIPEQTPNFAPQVSLQWEQSGNDSDTVDISNSAGNVLVKALVTDDNPNDIHTFDWSATNAALLDVDNLTDQFTFSPQAHGAGTYTVRVTVTDNGEPAQSTSISTTLTLSAQPQQSAGSLSWFALLSLCLAWLGLSPLGIAGRTQPH